MADTEQIQYTGFTYWRYRKDHEELRGMLVFAGPEDTLLIRRDHTEAVRLNNRDMFRIVFRRVYQKSTQRCKRILKGYLHQD